MPPKKDDKKGKKSASVKEVDLTEYIRPSTEIETSLLDEAPKPTLSGKIANVETLFPEWIDIESEAWSQPIAKENLVDIVYPKNLHVASSKAIKDFFSLNMEPPVDPKAKPVKKDNKKGQKEVEPELVEMETDYSGNPMPMIYKNAPNAKEDAFLGFDFPRPMFKYFSDKAEPIEPIGEESLPSAPVLEHSPTGEEVDHLICSAFRKVKGFAPAIIVSHSDDSLNSNYLWRGIYPKLKSGKPCYNPAGKYCVRLFLAGKWRKVYVDDVIPIRDDGRPALATSSNILELWPIILSKAIYTVYSACGYSTLVDDVDESMHIEAKNLLKIFKSNPVTVPYKISSFITFAIHVLTGWQPNAPISVTSVFLNEKTRSIKLLLSIASAGVIEIDEDNYIDEQTDQWDDKAPDGNNNHANTNSIDDGEEGVVLKTKKRFEEEYRVRKDRRDAMLKTIEIRERKIRNIQAAMNLSLSEVFFVVVFDHAFNKWRVLPILGICFPKQGTGSLNYVKILVDWKIGAPVRDPAADSPVKPKISRPDEFPLPDITPLKCEWKTIDDMMKGNAYIVTMDTLIKTPYHAPWSRHWVAPKPLAPPEPAGRSKSPPKKSTKAATPAPAEAPSDLTSEEPGLPPITLLRVDISQFYHMVPVDSAGNEIEEDQNEALLGAGEDDIAAALADQANELGAYSATDTTNREQSLRQLALKPRKGYLTLTVFLHADMTLSSNSNNNANAAKKKQDAKNILPNDVILILQEVRLDSVDPMMFVVEMKQDAYLPILQKRFMIPQNRLPEDPISHGPLVFWVRLFTKSSVYFQFSSTVDVKIGEAETIWPLDLNRKVFVTEGDSGVTQPNTEQLLFRCPLLKAASDTEDVKVIDANGNPVALTAPENCMAFVFVANRERAQHITLKSLTNIPASNPPHAQIVSEQGEKFELHSPNETRGEFVTMVCTVEPPMADPKSFSGLFDGGPKVSIPSFHWKLLVLAASPILEPVKPVNELPVSQRFRGKFIPNNKIALFRDIYSVEKTSFPISCRLTLSPLSGEGNVEIPGTPNMKDIAIKLKFYRKRDNVLISEHSGLGLVQCYLQSIAPFLEGGEPERPPTASKKDGKAPAKGKGPPPVETLDIIVECTLDKQAMEVPEMMRSRYPHYFDLTAEKNGSDSYSVVPLFQWQLDLLAGKVTSVAHDVADLQNFAAVKNKWEEATPGREERAIAAKVYSKERQKREQLPIEDEERSKLSSEMIDALVTALSVNNNPEEVKQRYELIHRVPVYEEHVELLQKLLMEMEKIEGDEKDFSTLFAALSPSTQISNQVQEVDSPASKQSSVVGSVAADKTFFPEYKENHIDVNEKRFADISRRLEEYGQLLRESTKEKINQSISICDENAREIAKLWSLRESYRVDVEKKNASLNALLKRAKDAIQIIKDLENPPPDPKAKKKK